MIIPIRCFTCNNLIAHKWKTYTEKIQLEYLKDDKFLTLKSSQI